MALGKDHPVDIYVGNRLRLKRIMLGLSQQDLGNTVGVTFQQIQKYEKGQNRIGASRLYEFSCTLKTDVGYFFHGMKGVNNNESSECDTSDYSGGISIREVNDTLVGSDKDILLLIRYYKRVENAEMRRRILLLVLGVAKIYDSHDTKPLISEAVN